MHSAASGIAMAALVAAGTCRPPIDQDIERQSPICRAFKAEYDTGDRTVRCVNPNESARLGSVQSDQASALFQGNVFDECVGLPRTPTVSPAGQRLCSPTERTADTCENRPDLRGGDQRASNVDRETISDSFSSMLTSWGLAQTSAERFNACKRLVCRPDLFVVSMLLKGDVGPDVDRFAVLANRQAIGMRVVALAPLVHDFCQQPSVVSDAGVVAAPGLCGTGTSATRCPTAFRCQAGECVNDLRSAWDVAVWPRNPSPVWTFGYRDAADGFPGILYYDDTGNAGGLLVRRASALGIDPNVRFWPGPGLGTLGEDPNTVVFHPGPTGQWSIIRFVPPQSGVYEMRAFFRSPTATTTVRIDWFPQATPQTPRSLSVSITPEAQQRPVWRIETFRSSVVDIAVGSPNDAHTSDTTTIDLTARFVQPL
jgi:hypothetical protein